MARRSVEKRDYRFNLQMSPTEKRILLTAADSVGLSASDYIRFMALRREPPAEVTEMRIEIYRELKRIGANINQMSRAANAAAKAGNSVNIDLQVLQELQELIVEVGSKIAGSDDV